MEPMTAKEVQYVLDELMTVAEHLREVQMIFTKAAEIHNALENVFEVMNVELARAEAREKEKPQPEPGR